MKGNPGFEDEKTEILMVNRYEVEQNAIFLDYKTQSLLQQIQKYEELKFHLRLSLVKNLQAIKQSLKDFQPQFFTLLEKLSKDHEEIQVELLHYFQSILTSQKEKGNLNAYKDFILGPLKNLAFGPYLEIKQESCALIGKLAHSLSLQEIQSIVGFADNLAKSENEENKIVAIQLLAKLTMDISPSKRESIFENQFLSIYSGSSVRVKKEIILELGKIAENINSEFVDDKIIRNFYIKQTKENAWGIRKACVEIITQLLSKSKTTKNQLCNILLIFLKDGNKFVRIASHKVLPQFIAKYGSSSLPQSIFDVYVSLIDLDINNQTSRQNQIIEKVSFYFPGVLQTVGASKWPQLSKLFNRLLHNRSQEVKRPLADGLHQISQIIGQNYSKQYLFSSLDYILREQLDSIKLCAIRNLAKFVGQFEAQTRQNLIDVFLVLQKDPKKWRVRFLISNQLRYLSEIYDAETNFKYLFPISLKLCNDQVSEVRKAACQQIVHVINQLRSQDYLYKIAIQSLLGYAVSEKYLQRQTFCMMVENLYINSKQFHQNYQSHIDRLCNDPVDIVKAALAISISKIIKKYPDELTKFLQNIEKLCKNKDLEEYFQGIFKKKVDQPLKEEAQIEDNKAANENQQNKVKENQLKENKGANKNKQVNAEQFNAEQVNAEQLNAEQVNAEQVDAEQVDENQVNQEQSNQNKQPFENYEGKENKEAIENKEEMRLQSQEQSSQ